MRFEAIADHPAAFIIGQQGWKVLHHLRILTHA
jgi:hypothetical protein